MSRRYAIVIENEDGHEVVSNIGQFEGGPPDIRFGTAEEVPNGVMIGMIRGGTLIAVGGFGFPEGGTGGEGRAGTIHKAGAKVLRTANAAKGRKSKAAEGPAPTADPNSLEDG